VRRLGSVRVGRDNWCFAGRAEPAGAGFLEHRDELEPARERTGWVVFIMQPPDDPLAG
jgi:hypothetical protein